MAETQTLHTDLQRKPCNADPDLASRAAKLRSGQTLRRLNYVASEASATPLQTMPRKQLFRPLPRLHRDWRDIRLQETWTRGTEMLSSLVFPLPSGLCNGIRPSDRTKQLIQADFTMTRVDHSVMANAIRRLRWMLCRRPTPGTPAADGAADIANRAVHAI